MPFTEFETARIEAAMSGFMARRRPPVEIRDKLDLAYRIEGAWIRIEARLKADIEIWNTGNPPPP